MHGKIYFGSIVELAEFLKEFTGSTACYEVAKAGNNWILTFNGGYWKCLRHSKKWEILFGN